MLSALGQQLKKVGDQLGGTSGGLQQNPIPSPSPKVNNPFFVSDMLTEKSAPYYPFDSKEEERRRDELDQKAYESDLWEQSQMNPLGFQTGQSEWVRPIVTPAPSRQIPVEVIDEVSLADMVADKFELREV